MTNVINESINDKGACRTAPATPGLFNTRKVLQSTANELGN